MRKLTRFRKSKRLLPLDSGNDLRCYRLSQEPPLSQDDVAPFYALPPRKGTRERIAQIEAMEKVPHEIAIRFRAAVTTARITRARLTLAEFENLKIDQASGR